MESAPISSKPTRQIRSSSAFSMKGAVTSRKAVAAASCVASLATRVLRWTCTARYNTDKTTAIEPTSCDLFMSFHCFRKRERLRHDDFDFLLVDQFADLGKLVRIRLDA